MANRRMFSMTIIDTDAFLEMPDSSQVLYFHLAMRADDDGFISNPKRISRMIGASDDDLKLLVTKEFLIPFESGVCVIRHWRLHNYIRKDRYTPTFHKFEKSLIGLAENNSYTDNPAEMVDTLPDEKIKGDKGLPSGSQAVDQRVTKGRPTVNQVVDQRLPQDRIGKDRLGKVKIDRLIDRSNQSIESIELLNLWNGNRIRNKIDESTIYLFTNELRKLFKGITKEEFRNGILKISESDYLLENISFDWFIKHENFKMVSAGKYNSVYKEG